MRMLTLLVSLFCVPAFAAGIAYNQITFSEYATKEVQNDILVAEIFTQEEGSQPDLLSQRVNKTINWALAEIKKHPEVRVQTLNYRTHPIYHKDKAARWKVQQTLRLESQDSRLLGELLSRLQRRLALQSVKYEISDEARRIHNDMLTEEAINRFNQKAQTVARAMGRKSFKIVQISIDQAQIPVARPPRLYRAAAREVSGDVQMLKSGNANVAFNLEETHMEAGKRDVRVTVHGTIELSGN